MDGWWIALAVLVPGVMILLGLLMRFFPPKKINRWYGYRTRRSMRSQKAWDIAQAMLWRAWLLLGVLGLGVALVLVFFSNLPLTAAAVVSVCVGLALLLVPVPYIEKQLKALPAPKTHKNTE